MVAFLKKICILLEKINNTSFIKFGKKSGLFFKKFKLKSQNKKL